MLQDDCVHILRTAGYDLIPADGVKQGKVKDLWIEQNLADEYPQRRRVIQYTGPARYLPRYATGCEACDNMPVGQMCEACDLEMTQNAASYRCQ